MPFRAPGKRLATAIASAAALLGMTWATPSVAAAEGSQQIVLSSGSGGGAIGTADPITTYSINVNGTKTPFQPAVVQCQNRAWGLIWGTRWIGASADCTVGDQASDRRNDYRVHFNLPAAS